MIFEEDYNELEDQIKGELTDYLGIAGTDSVKALMAHKIINIVRGRCEKNYSEYDIKFTKKEVK